MTATKPLRNDEPLRARDAQTVISPGVNVSAANDDVKRVAVESAPSSRRYDVGLIALGLLAIVVALALIGSLL